MKNVFKTTTGWTWMTAAGAALFILSGCSSGSSSPPKGDPSSWTQGVFHSPDQHENLCANPRTGINPRTNQPYADRPGTELDEKLWLRSMMHHFYLWTDEMSDPNPSNFSVEHYYRRLLVSQDQFSASLPEIEHHERYEQGFDTSYGIRWYIDFSGPALQLYVAQVEKNSPNIDLIHRGDRVLAINGMDVPPNDESLASAIDRALRPQTTGETHKFTLLDRETQSERTVELTAAPVTYQSVHLYKTLDTNSGTVGYLMLDDFNPPAQEPLISAVNSLLDESVSDLILDLRYNPGGAVDLASQLGFMIAGPQASLGKTFNQYLHNPQVAPYLDDSVPFRSTLFDFDKGEVDESMHLNSLNLPRIFVLTSGQTCSASETLINGLRGINIDVVQIGGTTCGKPYVYRSVHNCGMTYNFQWARGANDRGFGDYLNGFSPTDDPALQTSTNPPGCVVHEDLAHALGDEQEIMLATAIEYRETGVCPMDFRQELDQEETEIYPRPSSTWYGLSQSSGRAETLKRGRAQLRN